MQAKIYHLGLLFCTIFLISHEKLFAEEKPLLTSPLVDNPKSVVFIGNSFERPSLNWYAQKQIKNINDKNQTKCIEIMRNDDLNLYTCND